MTRMIGSRRMFLIVPLIAAFGLIAGCAGEGGPQTAELPKMQKQALVPEGKSKPAKGMDRPGSDQPVP